MGMYDMISGKCPKCGEKFWAQTKLGECSMNDYTTGDKFSVRGRIELKDSCQKCGTYPVAVFDAEGKLTGFQVGDPTAKEGLFGSLLEIGDSRQEQFEREIVSKITATE